ncbi:MAG TPA: PPC domain-containing protein [Candidatus Eisenbacteria bacterium]|nr:PPC domain-containing protein [Candidatus Eisenbacteria bacterium]
MRAPVVVAAMALVGAWMLIGCGKSPTAPPPPTLPPGAIAEVEPNDPTPQALGVLDTADVVIGGTASGRADVDYYTVVLSTSGSIYTSLSWTGSLPDLEVGVANGAGIMIHNQDSPAANPEACTVTGLGPGTYRVRVGTRTAANTFYLLTIGRR